MLNYTNGESENIGDLSCNVSYHLSSSTENAAWGLFQLKSAFQIIVAQIFMHAPCQKSNMGVVVLTEQFYIVSKAML